MSQSNGTCTVTQLVTGLAFTCNPVAKFGPALNHPETEKALNPKPHTPVLSSTICWSARKSCEQRFWSESREQSSVWSRHGRPMWAAHPQHG